jgi:RNA polymerase sigma factor (sigma-70 family)
VTFDTVFAELRAPVFKLCFRMLGSRHEAEDALQETFLAVHRGLSGFRGDATVKTWVYRIALRSALKVRADRETASRTLDESLEKSVVPEPALEAREEAGRLQAALASLSAEHRAVLALSALDGASHQEIAEVLGIPAGTVGSRLHNARKRLMDIVRPR